MANVQDLINQHNGVKFGVTGPDYGQCTAVAHAWEQMCGEPIVYGNAVDTFANANPANFDKVANTPTNVPPVGAILVWNSTWGGGYGHTAVVSRPANANTFWCFEQNDGDGGLPHEAEHNYNGITGWFIPRSLETPPEVPPAPPVLQAPPQPDPAPAPPPAPVPEPTPPPAADPAPVADVPLVTITPVPPVHTVHTIYPRQTFWQKLWVLLLHDFSK